MANDRKAPNYMQLLRAHWRIFDEFKRGTCWVAYTWHTGIDDPGRVAPNDPFCSRDDDRVGFEPQNSLSLMLNHYLDFIKNREK